MREMWRMLRDKDGQPTTLFHGVFGKKALPLDEWVESEAKLVADGTRSMAYVSGFHVLPSFEELEKMLGLFKNIDDLCFVKVRVRGEIRPKSHSRHEIYLADFMMVTSENWNERIRAAEVILARARRGSVTTHVPK